jgi:hypothetical protein
VTLIIVDVSEERIISIINVKSYSELGTTLAVTTFLPNFDFSTAKKKTKETLASRPN